MGALVQHAPGYRPTEAPFMFVGQRQQVERVIAVPWRQAAEIAASLPEATCLGPVLIIQMTGRCGSTVFCKVLEWLEVGCQAVSEPTVFAEVHEMLDRGLCTRQEAISALRAHLLMLVHQRRRAQPDKPLIVIKNRTLAASWRACELLPEALPDAKQLFQWRTVEDVVGSFHAAVESATISPTTRFLMQYRMDQAFWSLNGSPQMQWMKRAQRSLQDPLLSSRIFGEQEIRMEPENFARHGALGFLTFMSIFDSHIAVAWGRQGLWSMTLQYEDLMERKSACVREVLETLGWLHLVPDPSRLGTPEADQVFQKDAHAGGGVVKAAGTTLGGDTAHLEKAKEAKSAGGPRENAHLPHHHAEVVRDLMRSHGPLQAVGYDLGAAIAEKSIAWPRLMGQVVAASSEHQEVKSTSRKPLSLPLEHSEATGALCHDVSYDEGVASNIFQCLASSP